MYIRLDIYIYLFTRPIWCRFTTFTTFLWHFRKWCTMTTLTCCICTTFLHLTVLVKPALPPHASHFAMFLCYY
eukprot:UN07181